jgi:hypothetical protein
MRGLMLRTLNFIETNGNGDFDANGERELVDNLLQEFLKIGVNKLILIWEQMPANINKML